FLHLLRGCTRIYQPLYDSVLDKRHPLTSHPFTIERGAGLQRVRNVITHRDVLSKYLHPHPIVQEGALIENSHAREIQKHESHQVEYRGRLQNYRVFAWRE